MDLPIGQSPASISFNEASRMWIREEQAADDWCMGGQQVARLTAHPQGPVSCSVGVPV